MAMVAVFILIMSVMMAWVVYSTMWYFFSEIIEDDPMFYVRFQEMNMSLLGKFSALLFAGVSLSVFITLFISHRIAGPLFRLGNTMQEVGEGKIPGRVNLRKKDEFKELADSVNMAINRIEEMAEKDKIVISSVYKMLEDGSPSEKIIKELDALDLFQQS